MGTLKTVPLIEKCYAAARKLNWRFWAFPVVLVVLLAGAGACKVNGSSVGMYHDMLVGGGVKDSGALYGVPRVIRGDEWIVVTPMTAAQAAHHYKVVNPALGNGEDVSVLLDVPYKSWALLLRPWNLWFLVFPLEVAFALKWWTMLAMLGLVTYLLALKLMPRKYLFAALAASFLMLSPFVHWWYRDYVIATLALGLGALLLALQLVHQQGRWKKIGLAVALGYVAAAFGFIQYPPFQVMVGLPVALFYIGYLAQQGMFARSKLKPLLSALGYVAAALAMAIAILLMYYVQHKAAVNAVLHTTFPGHRAFRSGQGTFEGFMHLLASPFMAELQRSTKSNMYYWGNQSEAALFVQYSPMLLLPALAVVWRERRQKRRWRWDFLLLMAATAAIFLYLFVPGLTAVFKPLLFTIIPFNRFAMGLGLLDFLLLLLLARYCAKAPLGWLVSAVAAAMTFVVFCKAGLHIEHLYHGFISSTLVFGASGWMALALLALLRGKHTIAFAMLVVLSFVSVVHVNPLHRGLAPLTGTQLSAAIRTIAQKDPDGRWITTNQPLETYPLANGAKSITGNYSYPQKEIWRQLDNNPKDDYIYDRAVHVTANIAPANSLKLLAANHFVMNINPCSAATKKLRIRYVLTTTKQTSACLGLKQTVQFPQTAVYIYEVR